MILINSKLTVLFQDPFWIALVECECDEKYEVCKITFGAEPKDNEVYEFFIKNYNRLSFSRPVKAEKTEVKKINPKRMQREIKKATSEIGVGTKAQQALKLEYEQNKAEKKIRTKEMKEAEAQRRYMLRQQKKKQKHNGH